MFSIVIATRDRPHLLRRALESVAMQTMIGSELILVDDSGSQGVRAENEALLRSIVPAGHICRLPQGGAAHGPGGARNHGIEQASQPYVAFLDDDDEWLDPKHLECAAAGIEQLGLDLYIGDQEAIRADGSRVDGPVWVEDLGVLLPKQGHAARDGVFLVGVDDLMQSRGFAHLNTVIVRRTFAWDRLGGFDVDLPYEEDRDFFLRAIDVAGPIGYAPRLVARHHVPAMRASASTLPQAEKERCRLRVLEKAIGSARHRSIRARCQTDRAFELKKMSVRDAGLGQFGAAIGYGRAALRDRFGLKWLVYLASLYVRSAVARRSQPG